MEVHKLYPEDFIWHDKLVLRKAVIFHPESFLAIIFLNKMA